MDRRQPNKVMLLLLLDKTPPAATIHLILVKEALSCQWNSSWVGNTLKLVEIKTKAFFFFQKSFVSTLNLIIFVMHSSEWQ